MSDGISVISVVSVWLWVEGRSGQDLDGRSTFFAKPADILISWLHGWSWGHTCTHMVFPGVVGLCEKLVWPQIFPHCGLGKYFSPFFLNSCTWTHLQPIHLPPAAPQGNMDGVGDEDAGDRRQTHVRCRWLLGFSPQPCWSPSGGRARPGMSRQTDRAERADNTSTHYLG